MPESHDSGTNGRNGRTYAPSFRSPEDWLGSLHRVTAHRAQLASQPPRLPHSASATLSTAPLHALGSQLDSLVPFPRFTSAGAQAAFHRALTSDPRYRALSTILSDRMEFASRHGLTFGDSRDLYEALGYPRQITLQDYRERFERGDISARIVTAYPRATWAGDVLIQEDPDPEIDTAFERAIQELWQRHDMWDRIERADILAGLGHYSVLLIGARGSSANIDGSGTGGAVAGSDPLADPLTSAPGIDSILYITPLPEERARIKTWDEDIFSPRFGLPLTYEVALGARQSSPSSNILSSNAATVTREVHHSRIIHIAEGLLSDDIYGEPTLRSIWNRLDDLDKLIGGGSEAAWKRMDPGINVNVPILQDDTKEPIEVDEDAISDVQDQVDEWLHKMRRVIMTRGTEVKFLEAQAQTFNTNVETVVQIISAAKAIPNRILLGSERGELASTQDRANMQERVAERRGKHGTRIVRTIVDRFIELGTVPAPATAENLLGYDVVFRDAEELDEKEKGELVLSLAKANQAQVSATGRPVITEDEIRRNVLSLDPLEEVLPEGFEFGVDDEGDEDGDEGDDPNDSEDGSSTGDNGEDTSNRAAAASTRSTSATAAHDSLPAIRTADRLVPSLAALLVAFWLATSSATSLNALSTMVRNGDRVAVEHHLVAANARAESALHPKLAAALLAVINASAQAEIAAANKRGTLLSSPVVRAAADSSTSAAISLDFDTTNPRAVAWASNHAADLITEIGADTHRAVRDIIDQAFNSGLPPRKAAQLIRSEVGLHSRQIKWMGNLRREMLSAPAGTLITRFPPQPGLRTRPGFLARVPKGSLAVRQRWMEAQLRRYARMHHNLRARTIARTETLRASNEGLRETWRQGVEQGQLPANAKRQWIATQDASTRDTHAALHGETTGIDEPFSAGIEPGEEVNCRCTQGIIA